MSEKVGSIWYEVEADTSKLINGTNAVDEALGKAQKSMGKTDSAAGKLNARMTKLASSVRQANVQIGAQTSAYSGLTKVIGAYLSLRTIQAVVAMSDQYGQMASRIRNATSSAEEYEAVQARLLETANGTYRSLSEAQEVYLATADTLRDMGYATSDVLDITDSFSYALVRDAARADQATTAMDAYSKALMKGKVEADGWASIMAATPSIVNGISEATGRSAEEIRKLGATGRLSVEALNEGLRRSRDENKAMADEMETSVADAFTKLQNSMTLFVGKMNESSGASSVLTDNIALLADALQDPDVIKAAQDLAGGVVGALNLIIEGAKDTVRITQWAAESIAAALHGAASDDIVRLEDQLKTYQEMLDNPLKRLRIGGKGQAVAWFSEEEIKQNISATEAMIDKFYEDQENRPPIIPKIEPPKPGSTRPSGLVNAESGAADATKKLTEAQKNQERQAKQLEKAQKDNVDVVQKLERQVLLAALTGEKLAQKTAELSLNKYATPEQISEVQRLSSELFALEQIQERRKKFGESDGEVAQKIRGQVSPLSGGMFDDQAARYEAEAQAEQERYAAQIQRLTEAKELELEVLGGYQALELRMTEEHAKRMEQIERAKQQVILSAGEQGFGAMADIVRTAAGEQSGLYKTMFAASKAFAIAQATISIQQGIAQAAANPWPANLAAMASVAAATAGLVSNIASVGLTLSGGRQYGGPVAPSGMYRINENGAPEVFNAANGQQYMLPNSRGEVVSNADAAAGGGRSMNVYQTLNINGDVSPQTVDMIQNSQRQVFEELARDAKMNGPYIQMVRSKM
ncbi:tape measure protein [Stutzerimonas nitrititolerans]|uniref:tape measure protein n=1 Tax=Stutzerimonas nitrititolerans TaxID=2482751 RepID=UPI0028AF61A1|nr:tape measure protein [Stutzerimonas nitrititolerans]